MLQGIGTRPKSTAGTPPSPPPPKNVACIDDSSFAALGGKFGETAIVPSYLKPSDYSPGARTDGQTIFMVSVVESGGCRGSNAWIFVVESF